MPKHGHTRYLVAHTRGLEGVTLKTGSYCRNRIRGRYHRHHLKIHEIGPAVHPLLKERALIALHHLKAPAEIGVNPTRNVPQSLRRQPALVTETPVHGDGVTISEVFNNHVQHPYNHPSPTAEKRSNSSATCLRCWKKSSSRIFSLGAWPLLCAYPQPVPTVGIPNCALSSCIGPVAAINGDTSGSRP